MCVSRAWTDWGWGGCRGGWSNEQTLPSVPLPVVRVTAQYTRPHLHLSYRPALLPFLCPASGEAVHYSQRALFLPRCTFNSCSSAQRHLLHEVFRDHPLACTRAPPGTLVLTCDITLHSAIRAQPVMLIEFCAAQSISDKEQDYPQPRHPNKSNRPHFHGPFHPWPVQVGGSPGLRLPGGQPSSTPGPAPLRVQAVSAE